MKKTLDKLFGGNLKFSPYVVTPHKTIFPEYTIHRNRKGNTISFCAEYNQTFRDQLQFTYNDVEIICKRTFQNISDEAFNLSELGIELSGITFGQNPENDYFYHNENPRIYQVLTIPIDADRSSEDSIKNNPDLQANTVWADPGVISNRIGSSPYQPFPAVLFSNYDTNRGLVHGTLSQDYFFHNYIAKHVRKKINLLILSSFRGIEYMSVKPGKILTDEWYLGVTDAADNLEKIFEGYTNVLREKLPASYGGSSINRDNVVWGTWNDGIYRNISEKMILQEAKFLKENFPTCKWIQIDDGYAAASSPFHAHGLGMPYEGEDGLFKMKFPNGLKSVADKIKELGLRPAIWIGCACWPDTKIAIEHPDWIADYKIRPDAGCILDVSIPEVRKYMVSAITDLCRNNNFDGIKLDFWSYAFEERHSLLKNKEKSGYEYRDWWFSEIRKVLPSDGYLETGCDMCIGNPFLGKYVTNHRYGIDIAAGTWDYIKTTYLWGTARFATHTSDLHVPNSDSIGLLPNLSDAEAMFVINYCLVTHSMVEIAGRLSKCKRPERLKILQKAVCNPNNGQEVYFVNYDYRSKTHPVPEIMYFKTPHFSTIEAHPTMPIRTVGLFNLEEESKVLSFSASDIGIDLEEYILTDVWSGEQFDLKTTFSIEIPPHSSRLFAVSKINSISLFDANIRINNVHAEENALILETDYAKNGAELFLNRCAVSVEFNGEAIPFEACENKILVDIPKSGALKILF